MAEPDAPGAGPSFRDRVRWRRAELGSFHVALAVIGLVAFAWRAAVVWFGKRTVDSCGSALCGDAFFYSASANVLAQGDGFTNPFSADPRILQAADHPPLTTVVMAPANVLFWRQSVVSQRLLMAAIGAVVVVLIGLLARRVAGNRAGLVAAVIATVNANLWMNDVIVMAETIGALTLLAVLFASYRLLDRPTWGRAAVAGLCIGLAGLARAELLLYGPLLVVPVCLMARGAPIARRLGLAAVAGGVALLTLAPWTLHNLSRFEEPVLMSTNDGLTIIGANCDAVYGLSEDGGGEGFWNLQCRYDADAEFGIPEVGDQSVQARRYREIGLEYISNHTSRVPHVVVIRVARVWGVFAPDQMVWLNEGEGRDRWASWAGFFTWWVMIPLAAWGAIVLRRRKVPVWPLVVAVPVVTLTGVLFYGIVRFRLPADLAGTVLAAVALDSLLGRLRRDPAPDGASS